MFLLIVGVRYFLAIQASELLAGVGDSGFGSSSACSVFTCSVVLTETGLESWEDVAALVFAYLGLLRHVGPQRWVTLTSPLTTNPGH